MMSPGISEPAATAGATKRLPPNPRRRKIPPEQRKRVVQACNACNVRRIKCSGSQPCSQCSSRGKVCEYPPEKRKPPPSQDTYEQLQEHCSLLQRCLEDAVPSEKKRRALLSKWSKSPSETSDTLATPGSSADDEQEKSWEGRILQDPDGFIRYMGESSGAAFMDRLREFVSTVLPLLSDKNEAPAMEDTFTSLLGRYHTHDSRPLALPEVDLFYLPPPSDIAKLLAVFQFYAQVGTGSSNGGIYYWGNLWDLEHQARRYKQTPESDNDPHILAYLNAVMALACQYDPSLAPGWELYPGLTYFARAKHLLINPLEDTSLVNMQILSLMGHYLLGIYRRDAAYLYVGLAGRTAIIYGLHKGWMIAGQDLAGEEFKRQFWNTYILDRWLSCLMGRPPIIPEEAVDVDMPIDYPGSNLPPAAGLRAHIELSKIMDEIVNKVYGTDGTVRLVSERLPRVQAVMQKLSSWVDELPPSLQLHTVQIPDRACLMLHMMYNQLKILCTRPLLFIAAKHAVAIKYISSEKRPSHNSYSAQAMSCVEAARQNSLLCDQLLESNQAAVHSTPDYHYAFTAAIVLQLARLVPDTCVVEDTDRATSLLDYLSAVGDKGNESARDCARMVIELGAVVSRLLFSEKAHTTESQMLSGSVTNKASSQGLEGITYPQGQEFILSASQDLTSNSSFLDLEVGRQNEPDIYQELYAWFTDTTF